MGQKGGAVALFFATDDPAVRKGLLVGDGVSGAALTRGLISSYVLIVFRPY